MPNKNNSTKKQHSKTTYIVLTIIFSIIFCIFKILTFNMLSLFLFIPILLFLILYITYGIKFATKSNKIKSDYTTFWVTSISFILSGILFVDGGWGEPIFDYTRFIPIPALLVICIWLLFFTITIMSSIKFLKAKNNNANKNKNKKKKKKPNQIFIIYALEIIVILLIAILISLSS